MLTSPVASYNPAHGRTSKTFDQSGKTRRAIARGSAPSRAPVLRSRRASDQRRRVRHADERAETDSGGASGAADARLANAARGRQACRGLQESAPLAAN